MLTWCQREVLSHGWVNASLSVGDTLSFPLCLDVFRREGEGVRVFWDRLREPSFTSRWNPFATDYPFITFTYHPVRSTSDTFTALCDVSWSFHDNSMALLKGAAYSKNENIFWHTSGSVLKEVVVLFAFFFLATSRLWWRSKELDLWMWPYCKHPSLGLLPKEAGTCFKRKGHKNWLVIWPFNLSVEVFVMYFMTWLIQWRCVHCWGLTVCHLKKITVWWDSCGQVSHHRGNDLLELGIR